MFFLSIAQMETAVLCTKTGVRCCKVIQPTEMLPRHPPEFSFRLIYRNASSPTTGVSTQAIGQFSEAGLHE